MIEPDFGLLPDDPQGFFDLDPGFSPRELKRSYTRLIKRFKPERDPVAFQAIRAAYEQLRDHAPVRVSRVRTPVPVGEKNHKVATSLLKAEADAPSGAAEALALLDRISNQGARASYELLAAKQPKVPEDYPRLALLADLHGDGRTFLDWLLEGLRRYPLDEGLEGLLTGLCRDGLPSETLPLALERLARALTPGRFYKLTLPLWLGFLRQSSFHAVRELLAICEDELSSRGLTDRGSTPRLLFFLRFLRAACWSAPEAWIRETLAFLSQHHARLPDGGDQELDFMELLLEYLQVRSRFCDGSPATSAVDACLRGYCELPETELDALFLASQQSLRGLGDGLLWQFGPGDEVAGLALAALTWVARDVESRRFAEPPQLTRSQVGAELRRVEAGYRSDPRRELYEQLPLNVGTAIVLFLPVLLLLVIPAVRAQPLLLVLGLLAWMTVLRTLGERSPLLRVRRAIALWVLRNQEQLNQRLYLRRLRPAFSAFLLRTHLRAPSLANLIEATCETRDWSWDPEWLANRLRHDPGVGFLSLANRFARV
jgi:hypothetical protein